MEVLQQAMLKYYGLILKETGGNTIFVLKFDEFQVVQGQRLEHVSVTLMSRALKGTSLELDASQDTKGQGHMHNYYGIQS